jgi:hypothetical protein
MVVPCGAKAQIMQRKSTFLSWQCSFGGRQKHRSAHGEACLHQTGGKKTCSTSTTRIHMIHPQPDHKLKQLRR